MCLNETNLTNIVNNNFMRDYVLCQTSEKIIFISVHLIVYLTIGHLHKHSSVTFDRLTQVFIKVCESSIKNKVKFIHFLML